MMMAFDSEMAGRSHRDAIRRGRKRYTALLGGVEGKEKKASPS